MCTPSSLEWDGCCGTPAFLSCNNPRISLAGATLKFGRRRLLGSPLGRVGQRRARNVPQTECLPLIYRFSHAPGYVYVEYDSMYCRGRRRQWSIRALETAAV